MRKFRAVFGLLLASIALGSHPVVGQYDEIFTGRPRSGYTNSRIFTRRETPMHKAIFTQRGYIQFLRWELPVPEMEEFTFCLWVKSSNLTYSHSIFSYSKDEKERLVRSWISPYGRSVHLEIGEHEIMAHPTSLKEHRWYHICQSWENRLGRYALWINGLKEVEGYATQLSGHVIPSKGDIVVGQEYTDFDKGYEEGIEGAVLGFNLLLTSAFDKSKFFNPPDAALPPFLSPGKNQLPGLFGPSNVIESTPHLDLGFEIHPGIQLRRSVKNAPRFAPRPARQGPRILDQRNEAIFESTLREYLEPFHGNFRRRSVRFIPGPRRPTRSTWGTRRREVRQPNLGLQLVDLTYRQCQIGRGSPFIGGSKMLISWTRTPVKVFGGAILKNAKSTCGNF